MKRILVLALCLPHPAQAAIECKYHELAVAEATVIVQIDQIITSDANAEGYCAITGTVQRSFKGDTTIGSQITVTNPCNGRAFPPGPQIATDQAALAAALVLELHLTGGEVASHGAGLAILPALTDAPARTPMCDG
ncbi:MAG: hypothetical protein ACRC6I_09125 [Paracoccaceae bacterium]